MNVGENIRRLRVDKKITQSELAEVVGISQAMLCQIERGTKNPSLQIGKEISDALGCTIDELLCEDTDDDKPADPNQTTKGA